MMVWLRRIAIALLGRYGASLRFPHLLLLAGTLFGVDLIVPDAIPFLDEVFLGLATLMFGAWKRRDAPDAEVAEREGA